MSANSEFLLPNNQPFVELDCTAAFNSLTEKEKLYAHHLSQACWTGGLIVLVQTSPESPLIHSLLHRIVVAETLDSLKTSSLKEGVTEEEWTAFLVYTCGFFSNAGNYKSMGDTKFIPNLPKEKFRTIVNASKAYKSNSEQFENLWNECHERMYLLSDRVKSLGLGKEGISTYFSGNCTLDDANLVGEWMRTKKLEAYICRTCKTMTEDGLPLYSILLASVEKGADPKITMEKDLYKNCYFQVIRGDYSPILKKVNEHLEDAIKYAANDNEVQMLQHYKNSFQKGDLDEHKNGSRFWIKDKGPVIETYQGFIETYRDPSGQRGEFEGFVAMVNKKMSEKFKTLVDNAETFLTLLPWGKDFEKDKFLQPDFTSLDVLTFAGSGVPAGINIPNYDEIRQTEGFKNVSLGNVIPAHYKDAVTPFLSQEDSQLLTEYRVRSFEVQVGLHELLGHGSGKLFYKRGDNYNFDIANVKNPLTGEPIKSWYLDGETYDSQFTSIGSTFEECRAEAVGLYLSLDRNVLKVFGYDGKVADDIIYTNWLSLLWNGAAKATEMYQPVSKTWLQAHAQARFVLMRLIETEGEGMLRIEETEPGKNLKLTLDRTKIETIGKKVIGDFLLKLQVLKSTGDAEGARKLFAHYSELAGSWAGWRDIVIAHKTPRKILVQPNTKLAGNNVELVKYESDAHGMIQSWVDRFPSTDVDDILEQLAEHDKKHYVDMK